MKILLVSQYFYPENFKANDIAFDLQQRGYQVTVLTGIPNYPNGKFSPGYSYFKKRTQTIKGVKIIRCFLIPRGKGGTIRLALNYLSWAIFASFAAIFLAFFKKFDRIIVHQTSPVTAGLPAVWVKWIQKTPLYFWVLDLWPESLESASDIKNPMILNCFRKLVRFLYYHSDKILISSKGFRDSIVEKGDFADKIIYFPNWAESSIHQNSIPELLNGINFPKGTKIMFAGNIGVAQDVENILRAFRYLKEEKKCKDIYGIFVGDGRDRDRVQKLSKDWGLQGQCLFLGRYPVETMPAFFSNADAMLVSLKDEPIFNITVPARIQAYMSAGKPILSMMNGEGSCLIEEVGCGLTTGAGNYKALAENMLCIQNMDKKEIQSMGEKGKIYFANHFTQEKCINHLEKIIN